MIIDRHGGSIDKDKITISLGGYEKDSFLDCKKTLKEQGVNTDGDYNIVYNFEAESRFPILTTQQLTKAEENEATREDELKQKLKEARERVIQGISNL